MGSISKTAWVADWLALSAVVLGSILEGTASAVSVPVFFFIIFLLFSRAYGTQRTFGNTDS